MQKAVSGWMFTHHIDHMSVDEVKGFVYLVFVT